jgi:hypothetical protein
VQFLLTRRANPRTVFFAGYADQHQGEGELARVGRTLFLKLAYAWRL